MESGVCKAVNHKYANLLIVKHLESVSEYNLGNVSNCLLVSLQLQLEGVVTNPLSITKRPIWILL